jgi:hypothetical protein
MGAQPTHQKRKKKSANNAFKKTSGHGARHAPNLERKHAMQPSPTHAHSTMQIRRNGKKMRLPGISRMGT